MLPFGYWTSGLGSVDSGTLGSRTPLSDEQAACDPYPKAPPLDALHNCHLIITSPENQSMLNGQLEVLKEKLKTNLNNTGKIQIEFQEMAAADKVIFDICTALNLVDNVKYLALEIHDAFMGKVNDELVQVAFDPSLDSFHLKQLEARTQDLALLRIGTCIQLASKMNTTGTTHQDLSVEDLSRIYEIFGYKTTMEVIRQSEIRVFSTLNYNLNILTKLDVVESILIQLGLTLTEYRRVYTLAIYTVDYMYLSKQKIANEFYRITASRNPNIRYDRKTLRCTVDSNRMIEGCGIVVTTFVILHMEEHPAFQVARKVVTTQVDIEHVINLSLAIINCSRQDYNQIVAGSKTLSQVTFPLFKSSGHAIPRVSPTTRNT